VPKGSIDVELRLKKVPVRFHSEVIGTGRAEGNDASWLCECGDPVPLVGRCYYQFGDTCFTRCPSCNRKYRVIGRRNSRTGGKTTTHVKEI